MTEKARMAKADDQSETREDFFTHSAPDRGLYGRRRIEFTVLGVVVPQGSSRSFGFHLKDRETGRPIYGRNNEPMIRTVTTSDNPNLKEWRRLVADAARAALPPEFAVFTGPVALEAVFHLPKPKSAKRSQVVPTTRPDLDKCLRGILDALSNVVFRDDGQVYRVLVEKRYAAPSQPACALIAVEG